MTDKNQIGIGKIEVVPEYAEPLRTSGMQNGAARRKAGQTAETGAQSDRPEEGAKEGAARGQRRRQSRPRKTAQGQQTARGEQQAQGQQAASGERQAQAAGSRETAQKSAAPRRRRKPAGQTAGAQGIQLIPEGELERLDGAASQTESRVEKPAQRQRRSAASAKDGAGNNTKAFEASASRNSERSGVRNQSGQNGRRRTAQSRRTEMAEGAASGAKAAPAAAKAEQTGLKAEMSAPKAEAAAQIQEETSRKQAAGNRRRSDSSAAAKERPKSAAEVLREQREARNRQGRGRGQSVSMASTAVEFSQADNPVPGFGASAREAAQLQLTPYVMSGETSENASFGDKRQGTAQSAQKRGRRKLPSKKEHVKIIPLGGLEQIGMNITAFEYKNSIVVVDCGMAFPEDDMLGIDLVVPDVTYLKKNFSKVKGFFITHGHEDHIGALPYVLRELNVPVYSTRLTIALIENKLREAQLLDSAKLNIVKHGDIVPAGDFQVEFIKTNHSIQDASALAIHSPAGILFHTGDFKVDYTPVFGDAIDLQRFAELGKQGVLALMADSTNALRPGFTMSERTVGHTFDTIFAEHPKNRIIIATFASNVDRVQQVINDAEKYDRKVVIEGRSMVNVIGTAAELGYIKIKDGTLIDIAQLKDYPPEKTVLVTTGSQGEAMAALSRMASGQHRKVTIMPGDVIVLSSTPIPGNEKAVAKVINELAQRHAEIINQDTHVSGHACQEELKLIYSLIRPKFAIPVHGEYRHRIAQKKIAESVGIPQENILIADTGDVIDLSEDGCKVVDHVQAGPLMVDGLGVGDVGNIVMRDRQNLAQNGIIIVVLAYERRSNRMVGGPDVVSRGFVYVRENEELMEDARVAVMDAVDDCEVRHISDWSRIKNEIREALSDFFWKRMKRTPVILPIITEI